MSSRAHELLQEALTLELEERADLAARLPASLDAPDAVGPTDIESAWAREIERRVRRIMSGDSAGEPWENVRARVARRIAGQ